MTIIREFKKEDLPVIIILSKEMADLHYQIDRYYQSSTEMNLEEDLKEWLKDKNSKIFIAEKDGQVIGYARGTIEEAPYYSRSKMVGQIDNLIINAAHRERGVGKRLFYELRNWFKKRNVQDLRLNVDSRNQIAIKFWEKMGFEKFSLRMRREL